MFYFCFSSRVVSVIVFLIIFIVEGFKYCFSNFVSREDEVGVSFDGFKIIVFLVEIALIIGLIDNICKKNNK